MGNCLAYNKTPWYAPLYSCIIAPAYSRITENLYIGNYKSGKQVLKDKPPITHILSLTHTDSLMKAKYMKNNIEFHQYVFDDNPQKENIIEHFNKLKPLLKKILLEEDGVLLIHCHAGASRSVFIGVLTLIELYGYDFNYAYELIDEERFTIKRFYNQVKNYYNNR